jgi:hypothetical protein
MKCEKFQGITTEEACLAQQRAKKILCQTCNERLGVEVTLKHCKKCGENKPVTEFSPDKKTKDGQRAYCKPCTAALSREYHQKKKDGKGEIVKAKPEKEKMPTTKDLTPRNDIVGKLIAAFKEKEPEAFSLYDPLQILKEFGADFEMPPTEDLKMIPCATLHVQMSDINPCLFRNEMPCISCYRGLTLKDANNFLEGKPNMGINVKKKIPIQLRQGGRHKVDPEIQREKDRRAALEYYHKHKVLKGSSKKERVFPDVKLCPKPKGCGEFKRGWVDGEAMDFYRKARVVDGLATYCKKCEAARSVKNTRARRAEARNRRKAQ